MLPAASTWFVASKTLNCRTLCAGALSESTTLAVSWCRPTERSSREKLAPTPITPSRLEVQVIGRLRSPSSGSLALPVNAIGAPASNAALFDGAEIETDGEAFPERLYSTWSSGAPAALSVERLRRAASAAGDDQHDRVAARPGARAHQRLDHGRQVRGALIHVLLADHAPREPASSATEAAVRGRADTLFVLAAKVGACGVVSPWIVSDAARRRDLVGLELHPGLVDERALRNRHAGEAQADDLHVGAVHAPARGRCSRGSTAPVFICSASSLLAVMRTSSVTADAAPAASPATSGREADDAQTGGQGEHS